TLFVGDSAMQTLRAQRKQQAEERLRAGPAWRDGSGLVFLTELGEAEHPDHFSRRFKNLATAADVPLIRLHDLRHTNATLSLKAGVHPKVVSERLGHASIAITLDLYSHVTP